MRRATRVVDGSKSSIEISIHALLAESDAVYAAVQSPASQFLSTLSLRRATYLINTYHRIFGISIHALLAESDRRSVKLFHQNYISIHALLAESDASRSSDSSMGRHISIHALLAESDVLTRIDMGNNTDFYPRSPCGERQYQ